MHDTAPEQFETGNNNLPPDSAQTTPLQGPGSLALLTFMAGPHISVFPAFAALARLNASFAPKAIILLAAILYPVLYGCLLLWKAKWYWATLTIAGAHMTIALIYYFLFRKYAVGDRPRYVTEMPTSARQEKRYTLAGMAGGAVFVPLLGAPLVLLFLLESDRLLANLMPLAFDDVTSIYLLVIAGLGLILSGFIAGGWAGRLALKATPVAAILGSVSLVWIVLLWYFCLTLVIMLPAFVASKAESYAMGTTFTLFLFADIVIGSWWTAFIMMYTMRPAAPWRRLARLAYATLICLSSAFILALTCGYQSSWYYSAGQFLEKRGNIASALWCYEQGLGKNPTGPYASYLQYRIALSEHKLGHAEKAVLGFGKIVSMYNYNEILVREASTFLDNIERNGKEARRVVLPGVDNPTTYKGAYCVPNSLALVMNYWGTKINAEEIGQQITSLASGTMTVDQAWFARQKGFKHEFIPMGTTREIKEMIDAGFPVMVYVPQHVFVIVGYDEQLETFVTYDVATADVWVEYLQKDFIKTWKKEDATMIIAYPDNKQAEIPAEMAILMQRRSERYLQFQLSQLPQDNELEALRHLEYAAQDPVPYFFPLVSIFQDYPAKRGEILNGDEIPQISQAIRTYYERDFDEGLHLAGQYDDPDYANADKALQHSLDFLVGTGQIREARDLITTIKENGIISDDTAETLAMLNLAAGDIDEAMTQLEQQNDNQLNFYLALSHYHKGQLQGTIPGLIKTIDGCT